MGKSKQKRKEADWEEVTREDEQGQTGGTSSHDENDQGQADFDPYLDSVKHLKMQLEVSQKAMKKVHTFYTNQEREIREVAQTKQDLRKERAENRNLKNAVAALRNFEKDKDAEYKLKLADIDKKEQELQSAKEKVEEDQKKVEDDKVNVDKRMKALEAEQALKLQEQQTKLEEEHDEQYRQRVEAIEKEFNERQIVDQQRIADLEAQINQLSEELETQRKQMCQRDKEFKYSEMLRNAFEAKAETLKQELLRTENEFALNCESTDFYHDEFLKIFDNIKGISSRHFKELHVNDLDKVHDQIQEADGDFTFVPISNSEASEKLRIAHSQRVISSQLREIIWQPFSSELTLQESSLVPLLSSISSELTKSPHSGHRAARLHAALTMRGLQSQSLLLTNREEAFTNKVMGVLSLLIDPSQHSELRENLSDLAKSAISLWNTAQIDEREIIVHPDLDPEGYEGCDMSATGDNKIFVLLPRVTVMSYPRLLSDCPKVDPDGEPLTEAEICINPGDGLPEWSDMVAEGEEEEEERKDKVERERVAEKIRELEEEEKRLKGKAPLNIRRISAGRRDSMAGSNAGATSPSAMWMNGSRQNVAKEGD